MIRSRIVCFVYFTLLFGTAHANTTQFNNASTLVKEVSSQPGTHYKKASITKSSPDTTPTSITPSEIIQPTSKTTKTEPSVCKPATTEATKGQCIFFLPTGNILQLVVLALTVGCLALLLTTLICTCQVCHLRRNISSLQLRHNNIDLRAIREKNESSYRDEGQVDGQPSETCFMLSEVITAQEESREDEERVLENKAEENKAEENKAEENKAEVNKAEVNKDTEQPSTVMDPNGDVTQENSHEPDAKAPESSDTGE